MINTTSNFNTAIQALVRNQTKRRVTIGNTVFTGKILTCKISDIFNSSDSNISVGAACANSLNLKLEYLNGFSYESDIITVEEGYDLSEGSGPENIEWVSMGMFYPAPPCKSADDFTTVEITAYDALAKMNVKYESQLNFPTTDTAIINEICTNHGIIFSGETLGCSIDTLVECTEAEMIGYMAGIQGKNAHMTRDNKLTFKWYYSSRICSSISSDSVEALADMHLYELYRVENGCGLEITRSIQYQDGLIRNSETEFQIKSVASGSEDNVIVSGTGKGISFDNPYITQTQLDAIYERIYNAEVLDCSVTWRGNPAVESGDVVKVYDKAGTVHNAFIGKRDIDLSSDYKESFESITEGNSTISFSTKSPSERKIKQAYTNLQEAIAQSSALINGTKGGIFQLTDSDGDGINDGWILSDNQDLSQAQNIIRANHAGIGISTDGGETYVTAMTGEGINADSITAGTLTANLIKAGHLKSANNYTDLDLLTGTLNLKDNASVSDYTINNSQINIVSASDLNKNAGLSSRGMFFKNGNYFSVMQYDCIGMLTQNGYVIMDKTGILCQSGGISANGNSYITGNLSVSGTVAQGSQEGIKDNIIPCQSKLNVVNNSSIYEYDLKADMQKKRDKKHYGFVISSDLSNSFSAPEEVINYDQTGIDIYSMTSILWKAVQELSDKVDRLESEKKELKEN